MLPEHYKIVIDQYNWWLDVVVNTHNDYKLHETRNLVNNDYHIEVTKYEKMIRIYLDTNSNYIIDGLPVDNSYGPDEGKEMALNYLKNRMPNFITNVTINHTLDGWMLPYIDFHDSI